MSTAEAVQSNKKYYTVREGSFRLEVPENHPEAVPREWTVDDKSGVKYEKHFKFLAGRIERVFFWDGTYGKSLNIELDADEDGEIPVIQVSANGAGSYYGDDLLKKLPNIEVGVDYRLTPYDFEDDKNKRKVGVSIVKRNAEGIFDKTTGTIQDFFWDGEKNLHDFPVATEEDKTDWPFYFKKVNKFLVKYAEEHVLPLYSQENISAGKIEYPDNELAGSVPF